MVEEAVKVDMPLMIALLLLLILFKDNLSRLENKAVSSVMLKGQVTTTQKENSREC